MRRRFWRSGAVVVAGLLSVASAGGGMVGARSQSAPATAHRALLSLNQPAPPLQQSTPAEEPLLRPGSDGPTVQKLQQHLERLGHYAGPIDGRYGATTAEAVRDFQSQHGQVADGVVGADTWRTLSITLNAEAQIVPIQLPAVTPPAFTLLQVASPQPPPSRLWLLLMPMVPLAGGGLTYLMRRISSKDPFAPSEPPPPPNPSP
ncbi:MAG: peptidoglycan-binding protein [Cyanobacteria bacterium Co-bin8]|nr:peptidoglycan-binding protein [Cyanobacteria bacterium Co-bin8]